MRKEDTRETLATNAVDADTTLLKSVDCDSDGVAVDVIVSQITEHAFANDGVAVAVGVIPI